jgi:hypothetical protein
MEPDDDPFLEPDGTLGFFVRRRTSLAGLLLLALNVGFLCWLGINASDAWTNPK